MVTQIINRSNPIKTFTTQGEVQNRLKMQYQVADYFIEVEKELI